MLQVDEDEAAECVVRKREVRLQACTYASPLTLYALNKCSSCLVVEVCKRASTYDLGSQPAAFVTDGVLPDRAYRCRLNGRAATGPADCGCCGRK